MPSITQSAALSAALLFATLSGNPLRAQQPQPDQAGQGNAGGGWQGGGGMRGMGPGMAGGRGLMGTVTEVADDHYTIKTDQGDTYKVFFSANTRILKQPAPRHPAADATTPSTGSATPPAQQGERRRGEGDRPVPQEIKPTEIKVGDTIMAGGEADSAKKTIGALMVLQLDPERAKQARELQAQYGKTWLAGRITAIDDTKITLDGMVDHTPHAFQVDENTSFRKRRDSITMADIKVGDQIRVEGAIKDGIFLATTVQAMEPPRDQPTPR